MPVTYADARAYLLALPQFKGTLPATYALDRIQVLLEAMGQPHEAYPALHIAGTNGKGSTASMLAAVTRAAGLKVGLHTSPHLWYVGERMRVDGAPASEAWLTEAVAQWRPLFEREQPSFFEATVALSFRYFAEQSVDLAIVEVGLGGRLDATNVVTPLASLITTIGLDHTAILGDTHAAIAVEKAGIIKPSVPTFTTVQHPEALATIRRIAAAQGSPFHTVRGDTALTRHANGNITLQTPHCTYDHLHIDLRGTHQHWNAALAVCTLEATHPDITPEQVRDGLAAVRALSGLRGRLEVLQQSPLVVADVAHNAEGIAHALAWMHAQGLRNLTVALGWMRDKDFAPAGEALRSSSAQVFPLRIESERAWPTDTLIRHLTAAHVPVWNHSGSARDAAAWFDVNAQPGDGLLITGSHQVVAQLQPNRFGR
ncbi:MAG: folylpolyglutamate synthase/dihydrofolate synthase family protein [Bacteroidota bacterium]